MPKLTLKTVQVESASSFINIVVRHFVSKLENEFNHYQKSFNLKFNSSIHYKIMI